MQEVIIVINPGSTSTKMALFEGKTKLAEENVSHPSDQLAAFDNVADQFELRMKNIDDWLTAQKIEDRKVVAVAGRGARLRPLESGSYNINEAMLNDLRSMKYSNHAGNLGALIADFLGKRYNVPAIIVDPITVDDFSDYARISGFPEIPRVCRSHALNIREVSRRVAEHKERTIEQCDFVVAHMGGGISIAAVRKGKIVDVNDALLGMGPFSTERAGALPIGHLIEIAFSGKYTEKELKNKLSRESGLKGYIGEADLRKVEERIDKGDREAHLYYSAMVYQMAKEIGAYAAIFKGNLDGIILTGGMAKSKKLVAMLKDYIAHIAEVIVIPGEFEMEALAAGAERLLKGEEKPKEYIPGK